MLHKRLIIFVLAATLVGPAVAEEGMWLLDQLDELDWSRLQKAGVTVSPSEIWDAAKGTGLAEATVSLGGCSASFVSPLGLIATNHHCAFRAIQVNSTPEDNILANGFVAADLAAERRAPGSHVYVLDGYDDVTERVLEAIPEGAGPSEREQAVEAISKRLVAACEEQPDLRCSVASMWGGLRYVLFRQLDLKDVRLVHAPALGIGEFGGDIDNWMWPRHTGDYSLLRAYVGPDGRPAEYAPENVPYRPRRWLTLATTPLAAEDPVLLLGYPGRTMRYRSSWEVAHYRDAYYPNRVRLLGDLIATVEAMSAESEEAAIMNASRIKYFNNGMKNNQGMVEGLVRTDLAQARRHEGAELATWIAADPDRQARFGQVLAQLEAVQAEKSATAQRDLLLSYIGRTSLLGDARTLVELARERPKADLDRDPKYMERNFERLRQGLERTQLSLHLPTERAQLRLLLLEAAALPAGQRIEAIDRILCDGPADAEAAVDAYLDRLFAGTRMHEKEYRLALFDAPAAEIVAVNDTFMDLARALDPLWQEVKERDERLAGVLSGARPLYVQALSELRGGAIYPDANGTLRFNWGVVKGYSPRDAVSYHWLTGLSGILEKDTGVRPFDSPPALLEAAREVQPEVYRNPSLDQVPVNFLATLDSTGGNSGSPVLNGRGELVGLLFDGNYESMAADWRFEPAITRSIMVDIRFVLWVMDRVYHADHLIREMGDPFGVLTEVPTAG